MEGMSTTRRAMWTAIISAILHEISIIIFLIYIGVAGKSHPNPQNYGGRWSMAYLQAQWQWRKSAVGMEIAESFFATAELMCFLYTVQVLRDMYREEKGHLRHIMANAFIIGGLLRLFEFLQTIGLSLGENFMASFPDLPYEALVTLTVCHDLFMALGSYVFEANTVAIMVGVGILSYFSFRGVSAENHKLSKRHGILGIVIVVFLVLVFFLDLAVVSTPVGVQGDWIALAIFGGILGLLLFPAWLIWIGIQLRNLEIPAEGESFENKKLIGNQQL